MLSDWKRFYLAPDGGEGGGDAQDPVQEQPEAKAEAQEPEKKEQVQNVQVKKSPAWTSQVSKDRRERLGDRLDKYASVNDLVDRLEYLSNNSVIMPKEDSSDEDIAKWRQKHDIPVGDEQYNLTDDTAFYTGKDGKVDNDRKNFMEVMRQQILQLGRDADLSRAQLQKVWDSRQAMIKASEQATLKQRADLEKSFAMRMGNAYRGDYPDEAGRENAQRADVSVISGALSTMPKLSAFLKASGALLDPALIRELAGYIRSSGTSKGVQSSQVGSSRQREGMVMEFNSAFYKQFEK